jgi:SAM-dependent methyltransferase
MTFKALARQIDSAATSWLPLSQPLASSIASWAALHGWDATTAEGQRLLARQALLDAIVRQTVPGLAGRAFATPLDALNVTVPVALADVAWQTVARAAATTFNPWGELYSVLISQPYRRQIGQFWTDERIAGWMVAWLLQFRPRCLADVGCGAGNFLLKAGQLAGGGSFATALYGCDVSPLLLNLTLAAFLTRTSGQPPPLPALAVQDCLDLQSAAALPAETDAVICNPPYTRHHQIAPATKDALQAFFKAQLRLEVSRQGTLAFFFLLKLIAELPEGGRAAVIAPMEVLDARYGQAARRALCQHTTLSAIVHFAPQMNAFEKVDVGASILLFAKGRRPNNAVCHLTLHSLPTAQEFLTCLANGSDDRKLPFGSLVVQPQDELLDAPKWFSIATAKPAVSEWGDSGLVVPLKLLAKVVRGIATGANEFFALPTGEVGRRGLEPFVVRTLQRNREAQDIVLDEADWQALSAAGKRVWLLYLNGDDVSQIEQLRTYLAAGEAAGYHLRSLVQTRRRWYAMEQREIPAIFFTILTRGNPRFILNRADVRPLNMFSLIYPNRHVQAAGATELLWALLNSSFSLGQLHSVSRTYGGNTLKVEPRELDNLPVINPLALPEQTRRSIMAWIDEFFGNRRSDLLLNRVDALVVQLLSGELAAEMKTDLPVQLRLFERNGDNAVWEREV